MSKNKISNVYRRTDQRMCFTCGKWKHKNDMVQPSYTIYQECKKCRGKK